MSGTNEQPSAGSEPASVSVNSGTNRLSVQGAGTAVIAIVAVIGLIVVSVCAVKLAGRAVDRVGDSAPPAAGGGEHVPASAEKGRHHDL
ncbi:hypothetical protein [Alienimonas californiensis]|uniref:Uncharacterized protein n=1 Tax=Alienimonas californiensis TaxID=2527989 RepID=A0A517P6N0_9PLAN|nr:hypothetical protein [Alienimonas californiensis]QDT15036.1 hypothetical protein CA12_11160 [Alienimonas californiensis]